MYSNDVLDIFKTDMPGSCPLLSWNVTGAEARSCPLNGWETLSELRTVCSQHCVLCVFMDSGWPTVTRVFHPVTGLKQPLRNTVADTFKHGNMWMNWKGPECMDVLYLHRNVQQQQYCFDCHLFIPSVSPVRGSYSVHLYLLAKLWQAYSVHTQIHLNF